MSAYLGVFKWWLSVLVAAVLLTGCGGGDGTTPTSISGTAATGLALTGSVELVDANGQTRNVNIGTNGAFTVDTTGLSAPLMLRATGNGSSTGTVLYSLADGVTGVFNITPLTHLAVELMRQAEGADAPANLAALFAGWNAEVDPVDLADLRAAMLRAQAVVNANLATQLQAHNLTPATFDFLRTAFQANQTGLDAVLDAIHVEITGNQIAMHVGGSPFNFNVNIDLTGFNIGGSSGGTGGSTGGGGSGSTTTTCATGSTTMTFADNPQNSGPYGNGDQVCFTASTTSLAFSGKTLTSPVQNTVVTAPYAAYTFTDAATGNKYEVVFNASALHEINVLSGTDFLGQFTVAAGSGSGSTGGTTGGGGSGTTSNLTVSVNAGGIAGANVTINGVPRPTTQSEFCGAITDVNSTTSLNQALGAVGTFTINSCSFSGSVGNVSATLAITSPISMTVPYTVVYTYN